MILIFAKSALLIISMTGYFLFFTQRFHIRMEFAPALLCAWTSNVLFAGGLLNILPHAAAAVFAGGCVLLGLSFQYKYRFTRRDRLLYGGFLLVLLYFSAILRNAHFTSYDNFSHWAAVVKDMLLADRMPNFEDFIIRFQSYPLGSSLFIYYICKIAGHRDACFLWAQLFMLLSFLFCLAVFVRRRNWYVFFLPVLFSIWALTADNNIYELRVDTLLPLAGTAAYAVIYYYRREPKKAVCCSAGLFALLINIKNSGLFFYAAGVACLAVYAWDYIRQHRRLFVSACLIFPFAVLFLWKRHVALVFSHGMETKHAMSLAHYGQELMKKKPEHMLQIAGKMLRRFTSFEKPEVYMLLVVMLLAVLLLAAGQPLRRVCSLVAAGCVCLAVYIVFMYAMYIVSMPLEESLRLASYDRYVLSVLIYIYGNAIIYVTESMCAVEKHAVRLFGISVLFAACPVWLCCQQLPALVQPPDFKASKRYALQKMIKRDGIEEGSSCFLYCHKSDDDKRYLFYLTRYEVWTPDILASGRSEFAEKKKDISDYDYLIVWDSDEIMDEYLARHGLAEYQGQKRIAVRLHL